LLLSLANAPGSFKKNGSEFNQFEDFKRGKFIIDTWKYGHAVMIPVGLNTLSSIVFEEKFENIRQPVTLQRGEERGHFLYGGSLFIMIFEPGRYHSGAIQVQLENQIGLFDKKSD
jgi:phosphatidylserine decarboxylase